MDRTELIKMTSEIVSAYVANNDVSQAERISDAPVHVHGEQPGLP